MRISLVVAIFSLITHSLFSQSVNTAYDFLRLPTSARANALGGHNISIVERDPSLIFHNPALLGAELDGMINVNYMNYISDINIGSAVFTKAIGDNSAWGVGASFLSYGSFDETSSENIYLGTFSAQDVQLDGFYSRDLSDRWRIGLALKFIFSSMYEYSSFGLAADVGLSYYNSEKGFSGGVTLKNMGAQLVTYENTRGKLPWDIQLGVSQKLKHAPIRFNITAQYLTQWKFDSIEIDGETEEDDDFATTLAKHLVFGIDFVPSENFWVGIGYNPKISYDMKLINGNVLSGFTGGAGVRIRMFEVSASVAKYHPAALNLMLSVSTTIDDFK